MKACEKRPVSLIQIETIANDVEQTLKDKNIQEVESIKIGQIVMDMLKPLDQVSYIRFASVYKDFTDIDSFVAVISEFEKKEQNKDKDY